MTKNERGQVWAQDLVRKAGQAMKTARGAKSAKWLSDRTDALGYRVSPTVIAKLDSAHRGSVLSVAELLVLAAALDIPPALLLFPGYPGDEVEFLPGRLATSREASEWFSGEGRLPPEAGPDGELRVSPSNTGTELVNAARTFSRLVSDIFDLRSKMSSAQGVAAEVVEQMFTTLETRVLELGVEVAELRRVIKGEEREGLEMSAEQKTEILQALRTGREGNE